MRNTLLGITPLASTGSLQKHNLMSHAGDDDDAVPADDADDAEAATLGDQPQPDSSAAEAGPSQTAAPPRRDMRQPPHGSDKRPANGLSPGGGRLAAEEDALQDPLANRLEVANAEEDGALQASRDQPTSTTDLADVVDPVSAAAADAAAGAADAAAEVALPSKAAADAATAEVALVQQARAAVAARDAASGQLPDKGHKKRSMGKDAALSEDSQKPSVAGGTPSEPSMSIPPNSDAVPAGIPQPMIDGQPISPANNVASSARPSEGATELKSQAHSTSQRAGGLQQKSAQSPGPRKKAGDVQDMKDAAVPSLGSLDFSGLSGVNVFKKPGAAAPSTASGPVETPEAGSKSDATLAPQADADASDGVEGMQQAEVDVKPEGLPTAGPSAKEAAIVPGDAKGAHAEELKPSATLQVRPPSCSCHVRLGAIWSSRCPGKRSEGAVQIAFYGMS